MSPKVMASFSAFGGDLPSIAFIVLHSLEGSVLWSSVSTNCLHVFLRCSFVVLVISSFICCRAGVVGSLDLRSSRALIFSNISAGTGSVLIPCRPEGICRDAAFRMMVRKIFSPFWQFDGSHLLLSLSSISLLYRSHIEITHPNNVNLKLAFHKVASFHPHYSTFTPQTYHHPVHRFRSWPMQMTSQSHPHTQVRVQPRNTYNHTYTKFLTGQNKTTSY